MADDSNEIIAWSDKLSCGIKIIDDQHKILVSLVNQMFNHVTGNAVQERDYFNKVIHELVDYVKKHFATEERILLGTKFSGYADHKKEHENFVYNIIKNVRDYEDGRRFSLSTFTRFLRDWILSHIALIDKQYFEYFKKMAISNADVEKISIDPQANLQHEKGLSTRNTSTAPGSAC